MIEKNVNIIRDPKIKRIVEYKEGDKQVNVLDSRFYRRDDKYYPSVTSVLNYFPKNQFFHSWLKDVGHNSDIIAAKAAAEGTQVHTAVDAFLNGEEIKPITPNIMSQKGISRTFQNLALFKRMSVLDNILVGRKLHSKANFLEVAFQLPRSLREEKKNRDKCEEIIKFLEIENIKNIAVGKLPYGLQKKVELGRALATEAEVLLLDEPMAGMNVEEKRDMCRFILKVNDELGTTIVLIEHDMGVVMDISDRVVVLDYGKIIGDDVPDKVRSNKNVIDAYLGVAHD